MVDNGLSHLVHGTRGNTRLHGALSVIGNFAWLKVCFAAETDPLTKTIAYAYDAASRLTAVTDRLGRTREFW